MKLRTVQNVAEVTTIPFAPETLTNSEVIEIELVEQITQEERCQAFILAQLAESVGNHRYYEDNTCQKLANALTVVVESMANIEVNYDLKDCSNSTVDESLLKESLAEIEEAIENLQHFKEYLKDHIELQSYGRGL